MAMKKSVQGSIRQKPNAITWVIVLSRLANHGEDATSVMQEWNQTASSTSKLVGGKAQSVKLILEKASAEGRELLASHLSEFGWSACCLSDDSLASKKVTGSELPSMNALRLVPLCSHQGHWGGGHGHNDTSVEGQG